MNIEKIIYGISSGLDISKKILPLVKDYIPLIIKYANKNKKIENDDKKVEEKQTQKKVSSTSLTFFQ